MKGRETLMRSHLRRMAKRKVSDFLLREEGMVGNRSAFATAAFVSAASLAMTLLVAPDAEAHNNLPHCPGEGNHCNPGQFCCRTYVNAMWRFNCLNVGTPCGNGC